MVTKKYIIYRQQLWGITGKSRSISCSHLSVEPDGEDVVGVAVVTNLCAFLEVVDVHSPWHGQTDDHHQTAGEQPLHYVHVWTLHWEGEEIGYFYLGVVNGCSDICSNQGSFTVNSWTASSLLPTPIHFPALLQMTMTVAFHPKYQPL